MSTNIHDEVTARIVAELEQGSVPWVKPWQSGLATAGAGCLPENAATGRAYAGVNILTLWAAAAAKGYPLPRWLTFRQARGLGGHVRKGERGTAVVLLKRVTVPDDKAGAAKEDGTREVAFLRAFTVFNVAQVDDLPERVYVEPQPVPEGERYDRAEAFLAAAGADVWHGGDRACYIPSCDRIQLPPFGAFEGPGHYYATSLHEHAHWTAPADRLDRDLSGRFGDAAYGVEELIAELAAAFLCAELGIEGRLRHAEYIGGWLKLLKADNRAVFAAASQASRAADYLRSFSAAEADLDRRTT